MIDRGDIRQAIDRCSAISGLHCRALVMVSSILADSLIAKFKEAGGTVRDQTASRVTAIISALVICIIVCLSWPLIITVITPLPTKPSATKMPENPKLANAAITDMQMRQRDVAALDAKYTKELADAKAENDALRDDAAAGRRRLHIKAVCQSVREAFTTPPAWIMQPPRLADTAERDYFTLRERLITMQNNWKEPRSILNERRQSCPYRWATHAIIVSNTHALPARHKCLK